MGKSDGIRQWEGTFSAWEEAIGWSTGDIAELFGCTSRRVQVLRGSAGTARARLSRADRIAMRVALEHERDKLIRITE